MKQQIKLTIFLFSLLFCFGMLEAQTTKLTLVYSNATSSSFNLKLDFYKKEFSLEKRSDVDKENRVEPTDAIYVSVSMFAKGSLQRKGNKIICLDEMRHKKYELQFLSEEKIINKTMPYIEQDTLYVVFKIENGCPVYFGRWENGKKEGYWNYLHNCKPIRNELYKDGLLMEIKNL